MKFFQRQRVDEVGVLGVKLQKLILFLIFSAVLSIVTSFGFSIWFLLCHVLDVIVLWVGFQGAHKKNEKALRFYVIYHVLMFALFVLALLFALLFSVPPVDERRVDDVSPKVVPALNLHPPKQGDGSFATIQEPATPLLDLHNPEPELMELQKPAPKKPAFMDLQKNMPMMELKKTLMDLKKNKPASDLHAPEDVSAPEPEEVPLGLIIVNIVLSVFFLVAFILRIVSIFLASRLARMIRTKRAQHLAHPVSRRVEEEEEVIYEPQPPMMNGYSQVPMQQVPPMYPYMMQPYFVNPQQQQMQQQQLQQYYMMQQMPQQPLQHQ